MFSATGFPKISHYISANIPKSETPLPIPRSLDKGNSTLYHLWKFCILKSHRYFSVTFSRHAEDPSVRILKLESTFKAI